MRPTTSYRLSVVGPRDHLHHMADLLVKKASEVAVVDQSGVVMDNREAFVRVRVASDDAAMLDLANEIVPSGEFVLTTGYGVHQRVIKS